jgi:hypothetical protein
MSAERTKCCGIQLIKLTHKRLVYGYKYHWKWTRIYRSETKVICWHHTQKYDSSEEKMNSGIRHLSPVLIAIKFLSVIPYTNLSDREEPRRT